MQENLQRPFYSCIFIMGENKLTFETIEIVPGTCLLSECLLYYSYTKYITHVKSILSYCYNSFSQRTTIIFVFIRSRNLIAHKNIGNKLKMKTFLYISTKLKEIKLSQFYWRLCVFKPCVNDVIKFCLQSYRTLFDFLFFCKNTRMLVGTIIFQTISYTLSLKLM